ncbi:deoxyribonuclease-2-alpha isoform X3 [Syngnathus scovelli]|uniref:deoxyribonuclease-2-alpha isoform X3 n=1 Tax=Syngnathus scovelli TaxID=161590 RepID=UPI00210FD742|nr:deoxyribonuclease-2-alpha isoform X3 [Syngnathus scovelli]
MRTNDHISRPTIANCEQQPFLARRPPTFAVKLRREDKMFSLLLLLCSFLPHGGPASPISCYNDQGDAVDWFYMYKLPKMHGAASGLMYLLLDESSAGWTPGVGTINDTMGALGRTLAQLYWQTQQAGVAYILYNDQDGLGHNHKGGHTKGVVLLDKTQGFWLIHSTPIFPPARQAGRYHFPDSGATYGQNFLCVSFPLDHFHTIGEQLQINQANVYDCDVPPFFAAAAPALSAVCNQSSALAPPTNRSVTLTSKGGATFVSFAKGAAFDRDLYQSWVAPALRSDLLVQFWIHSGGILPSDCSPGWKVLDVTRLSPGGLSPYNNSKDHSKWAVSPRPATADGGWLCVGDINRNRAEEKRGGGTLCQRRATVWKAYRTTALECQPCRASALGSAHCQ